MSNAPEEFENLQKVLKLKRYEQPPPGYFNRFSGRVIARLESGAARANVWEQAPWLRRLLRTLETNPLAAGLFGMSICGLLISGIVYSQARTPADYSAQISGAPVSVAEVSGADWSKPARVDSTMPSISPVFATNSPNALFNNFEKLSIQQVNFNQ